MSPKADSEEAAQTREVGGGVGQVVGWRQHFPYSPQEWGPSDRAQRGSPTFLLLAGKTLLIAPIIDCLFKNTVLGTFLEHPSSLVWLRGG